jgi:hypothetical protein
LVTNHIILIKFPWHNYYFYFYHADWTWCKNCTNTSHMVLLCHGWPFTAPNALQASFSAFHYRTDFIPKPNLRPKSHRWLYTQTNIGKLYPYPLLFFGYEYGYRYGSDNKRIRIGYYQIQNTDTDIIQIAKQNNLS